MAVQSKTEAAAPVPRMLQKTFADTCKSELDEKVGQWLASQQISREQIVGFASGSPG